MTTYYRIQPAKRDPQALVGRHNKSRVWVGEVTRMCPACGGLGEVNAEAGADECQDCRGKGEVRDVRSGVSVCRSVDDLIEYFRARGANVRGDVLVELEGDVSEDRDYDHGTPGDPLLIHPTRVVSVTPVSDELISAIEG